MVEGLQRVVVTGLGAVTPIGNTVADYWTGLTSGRNGVAPITLFDASAHACRFKQAHITAIAHEITVNVEADRRAG
mgnify:CR=1 FL=1